MAVSQQPLQGRRQNSVFSQYTTLNHPCKQATKRELSLSQGNLLPGLRSQSHDMTHLDHGSQKQEGWSLQTRLLQQDRLCL